MQILDQIKRQIPALSDAQKATPDEQAEYRRLATSWCDLLLVAPTAYLEKSPFSGECDTARIRLHKGDWRKAKKGDHDAGQPINDLGVFVIHQDAQAMIDAALRWADAETVDLAVAYAEQGEIFLIRAMLTGVIDRRLQDREISEDLAAEAYREIGLDGEHASQLRQFWE